MGFQLYGVNYTWKHLVLILSLFLKKSWFKGGLSEPIEPPLPTPLILSIDTHEINESMETENLTKPCATTEASTLEVTISTQPSAVPCSSVAQCNEDQNANVDLTHSFHRR